jgi:hypothetical protein
MNATRKLYAGLMAILITAALPGCSSWKALRVPPARYLAEKPHTIIRVSTREESRIMLRFARLSGDSLIGQRWMAGRTPSDWMVAVPIASLSKVEARRIDWVKTAVGMLATSAVVLILVSGTNSSGGFVSGL